MSARRRTLCRSTRARRLQPLEEIEVGDLGPSRRRRSFNRDDAELTKFIARHEVTDKEGKIGVIVPDDSKLCQVKYADAQIYGWIFWNLVPAAAARQPTAIFEVVSPTPNTLLRRQRAASHTIHQLLYHAPCRGPPRLMRPQWWRDCVGQWLSVGFG